MITNTSKYLVFSLVSFISAFTAIFYLDTTSFTNSRQGASFDNLIQDFTNNKWMWASNDIAFTVSIAIPFILLLLSIFFAVRGLKAESTQSKTQRLISITIATLSTGILISAIRINIYLGLTI